MNSTSDKRPSKKKQKRSGPSQFFFRGLAISIPPVLTLVIIFWVLRMVNDYAIVPIGTAVKYSIALFIEDTVPYDSVRQFPKDQLPPLDFCGKDYLLSVEFENQLRQKRSTINEEISKRQEESETELQKTESKDDVNSKETDSDGKSESGEESKATEEQGKPQADSPYYKIEKGALAKPINLQVIELNLSEVYVQFGGKAVPYADYWEVARSIGLNNMPESAIGLYMELVVVRYFPGLFQLTAVMVLVTIVIVYFLGRLVTARLGQWTVTVIESKILGRLPVVSNVYGSVKQVTDFIFTERQVEYSRVVAIEYPRRGIWSLGLVTSDSMLAITAAAGEPMVSILIPSSPMPVTGYTMSLPRKEVLDLDITVDQAFQFCISCGVLVPESQKVTPERIQEEIAKRLAGDSPVLPQRQSSTQIPDDSGKNDSDETGASGSPDSSDKPPEK